MYALCTVIVWADFFSIISTIIFPFVWHLFFLVQQLLSLFAALLEVICANIQTRVFSLFLPSFSKLRIGIFLRGARYSLIIVARILESSSNCKNQQNYIERHKYMHSTKRFNEQLTLRARRRDLDATESLYRRYRRVRVIGAFSGRRSKGGREK